MAGYASYTEYPDLSNTAFFKKVGKKPAKSSGSAAIPAKNQDNIEIYKVLRDPSNKDKKSYKVTEVTCWDIKKDHPIRIKLQIPRFIDSKGNEYTQKTVFPGWDKEGRFPFNCTSAYMRYVLSDYLNIWGANAMSNADFRKKHHFQHLNKTQPLFDIMKIFASRSGLISDYEHPAPYPGNYFIIRHFKLWEKPIMTAVSTYDPKTEISSIADVFFEDDNIKVGEHIASRIDPDKEVHLFTMPDLDIIDTICLRRQKVKVTLNPAIPYYLMYRTGTNYWSRDAIFKIINDNYQSKPCVESKKGIINIYHLLLTIMVFVQSSCIFPIGESSDLMIIEDEIEVLFHAIRNFLDYQERLSAPAHLQEKCLFDPKSELKLLDKLYTQLLDKGQYSSDRIALALLCAKDRFQLKSEDVLDIDAFTFGKRKSIENTWLSPVFCFPILEFIEPEFDELLELIGPPEFTEPPKFVTPASNSGRLGVCLSGFTILHDLFKETQYDMRSFDFIDLDEKKAIEGIMWYLDENTGCSPETAEKILKDALRYHRQFLQIKSIKVEFFNNQHSFNVDNSSDAYATYLLLHTVYTNQQIYIQNGSIQINKSLNMLRRLTNELENSSAKPYLEEYLEDYITVIFAINSTRKPYLKKRKSNDVIGRCFLNLDQAEKPKNIDYYKTTVCFANGYEVISYSPVTRDRRDDWVPYGQIEWNMIFHHVWQICSKTYKFGNEKTAACTVCADGDSGHQTPCVF